MGASQETLNRIAEILGVPVETFSGRFSRTDVEVLAELITLWIAIGRGTDRNKVLGYARAILAAQQQMDKRR